MQLLFSRRFLPLFLTQFLGAFNDNLFKNSMVMLITYRVAASTGMNTQILVTLAAGLFMLPYFLFSATAGQLADKIDRARLSCIVKIVEIILMVFAAVGFYMSNVWFLMFVLFCMGAQATFFGPLKYALLPQHLSEKELLPGNSYIEAGTFLAILLGTISGGLLILRDGGIGEVSFAVIFCAVAGYLSSRFIPEAPAPDPSLTLGYNIAKETLRIINFAHTDEKVYLCILGISWFWLLGSVYLSQFPTLAKDVVHGDETVVTLFLTIFSVGIGIGSMLCNKLLKGLVHSTYVPLAILGITIFTADLYYSSGNRVYSEVTGLLDIDGFLKYTASLRILADLFFTAMCGGIFIVPLYAIMQMRSPVEQRARIIAANNVMNAVFMVAAAVLTILMLKLHFTIPQVFLSVAILNSFVAVYICKLLPDRLMRSVAQAILSTFYRVEVTGLENFVAAGKRVLIIANHTSFLDAALIAAYLPDTITFAVNTHIAQHPLIRPFLALADTFPLDPTNPLATKALIEAIRKDKKCMIFPEGRITNTGALMKIYEGPGMIADKSGAELLPIRIDGAQYTPFSRLKGKVRIRWFPKITLTILPPCRFTLPEEIKGRRRRQIASAGLYDIMSQMMFDSSHYHKTLLSSLITARAIHGGGHLVAEDIERKPISYNQFITRSYVLGRLFGRKTRGQKNVGVLLPTATTTALTFFGLQTTGKIPAMLNFSASSSQIAIACKTAGVKTVLSSRRFIEKAKLSAVETELQQQGIQVICLEDIRSELRITDKLVGLATTFAPHLVFSLTNKAKPEEPAVILFTSGSEGTPKGVVLSHLNILANCMQLASRIDFGPQDIVFNCLPMFHAFGLTAATLLPILSGIKAFYYPSPLHYRIVPELIYDTNSTIVFGTDTFLAGYARFANPYDLHSVRYVFAGAEKLKDETRKAYEEKFGVRIFEGYGATETTPVLSMNTPMQNRTGTVGRLMPGIEYRLEEVPGIAEGGQLFVRGPNVMMGYLRAEAPEQLQPLADGWYDTGDIVAIDADGFISIKGRTKRFAKIGGEMVSLTAVEAAVNSLWQGALSVAVTVPDPKKGEQIVVLTEFASPDRDALTKHMREYKMTELSFPKKIITVKSVPLLGTGKADYQKAKAIALEDSNSTH